MNTTSTDLLDEIGRAEESFTVRRAFGEPFEKDGVTVIPTARVQGAVGGGGGEAPDGEGGGTGTGFAMNTRPVGVSPVRSRGGRPSSGPRAPGSAVGGDRRPADGARVREGPHGTRAVRARAKDE